MYTSFSFILNTIANSSFTPNGDDPVFHFDFSVSHGRIGPQVMPKIIVHTETIVFSDGSIATNLRVDELFCLLTSLCNRAVIQKDTEDEKRTILEFDECFVVVHETIDIR